MTDHGAVETRFSRQAPSGAGNIATSLFGGAILATVATVSFAQTYVSDVGALGMTTISSGYIALGGYSTNGDGGGGVLLPLPSSVAPCAPDGGLEFQDQHGNCFVRANPTNSVREWGALCDVTAVQGASWTAGTLYIPGSVVSIPPQSAPQNGELIAISQIGVPTLWGSSTPAVSMTRFSTLSNTGTNYVPGDLISFVGGTFSQQAAIIVDAVDGSGAITQWHFLWGGLYNAANPPTSAMAQDNTHSYCGTVAATGSLIGCGMAAGQAGGAKMMPTWSGWSVLNKQKFTNAGTNYAVGDIVTVTIAGATPNQNHYATLVVEGTSTMGGVTGAVTAYDWIDYGSFAYTLASIGSLTAIGSTRNGTVGSGASLAFAPGSITLAPFTTTIAVAGTLTHNNYPVTLVENPSFVTSGTVAIQYLYYGHDDSPWINAAIKAAPKGGLVIPAGCGTMQAINLSPPNAVTNLNPAQNVNTFLRGANLQSSGLYAFAPTPSTRTPSNTVLAHVIYSGLLSVNAFLKIPGGGFSNMFVEGLGIPEGYGYYGLVENIGTPSGYMGPTFSSSGSITNNIPTAGNVVEIDAASLMRIDKVLISDGGVGPGNSALQCGLDESDPTHNFVTGSIANITLTDSRLDVGFGLFGPTNPDFVLRLDASCHDSVYDSDVVFDGAKADILVYNGNLFGRIHVNSDAANSGIPLPSIPWPRSDTFDLAGLADYGFYVINNTSISETQCDVANKACIFTTPSTPLGSSFNPGQITDTQMKCGSYVNTPPGYFGVELSRGTANTTVTGTAPSTQCTIYPFQLVQMDGPVGVSTSMCGNSNASVAGCTGYQGSLAQHQSYTQPAVAYTSNTVTSTGLFAVPFVSPAVGATITQLGINVTTAGSSVGHCLVGIYNAAAQIPTTLVAIGTVTTTGTIATAMSLLTVTSGGTGNFKASLPAPGAELAPGTLYFLAVACDGIQWLEGVAEQSGLSAPLVGVNVHHLTATATGIVSASWSYPVSGPIVLPSAFGTLSSIPDVWVPNVYAEP